MRVLIISDFNDILSMNKLHYSITKGFELAKSWAKIADTYFLTSVEHDETDLLRRNLEVKLVHYKRIDKTFLDENIDCILFVRETSVIDVLDRMTILKDLVNCETRRIKIGIKSDNLSWLLSKPFKRWTKRNYNKSPQKWAYKCFDVLYCQTKEYYDIGLQILGSDPLGKVCISPMAVPEKMLPKERYSNPYPINHSYCVINYTHMKVGKAFLPLKVTPAFHHLWPNKVMRNDFDVKKTILVFMGRMKVDHGKIIFMMRDIMLKLGSEYELHIFPGTFIIPNVEAKTFSSKNSPHLQFLRDNVFHNNDNVIIHFPYQHEERFKYLYYADIGLDFCQARPYNHRSSQGNAKLLEYCSFGLPTVTERNVNNSYLVENAGNGILLDGVATVDEYVEAIKKLKDMPIDRQNAQRITIENENWGIRARNIIKDFEKQIGEVETEELVSR